MKIALLLLGIFIAYQGMAHAEIYKCVDKDGNVRFTSTPGPGCVSTGKSVEERNAESLPRFGPLAVTGLSSYLSDSRNYLYIDGAVKNNSATKTLKFIKITVKILAENKQLLKVESTYVSPLALSPGQEGTFKIMTSYDTRINSYITMAHWQ